MRKFLGFIALIVLVVLPFKVNAASYGIGPVENEFVPDDATGNGTVTLVATQSGGTSFTSGAQYTATMTLTNLEYVSVEPVDGVQIIVDMTKTEKNVIINFSKTFTDAKFTLAKMTFHKTGAADDECGVVIECNGISKEISNKKPKNPKTGNALPYVVIIAGATIATGVYFVTRRNTKFYRI